MATVKSLRFVFCAGVCLLMLEGCVSKASNPPPDAGTVADAGAPPYPPVIPEGHVLLTSSETQSFRFTGVPPYRGAFVAQAGRHYDLFGSGLEQCSLILRDPSGATLGRYTPYSDPSYRPRRLHWSGLAGGAVYTVELERAGCPSEIFFVDRGPDDHGDLLPLVTPGPTPGQALTGVSEHSGDLDLTSFDTVAGHIYSLGCTFAPPPPSFPPTWDLYFQSPTGVPYGGTSLVSVAESGDYYTAFESPGGVAVVSISNSRLEPSPVPYSCTLRDMGTDDHGDTAPAATVLAADTASVQGKLETDSDSDVFSLSVHPQHLYRVSCDIGSLHACNVTGAASEDASTARTVYTGFKASQSLHFLHVYGDRGGAKGWLEARYTLEFEDLGEDDHGDSPATATLLTGTTQEVQGRLSITEEEDFFSFPAIEGRRYRVSPAWREVAAQERLFMSIKDAQGREPPSTYERAGAQWIHTFTAPTTGAYFISLAASAGTRGDYTLQIEDLGP
ncbi:hypothetical protein [Corallococcus sicarius]|uniref:Peptidase C-terminal archaeal/bacterial domain-containing protein n=1 Tax=Corallococcus sicarius TaxID=2316726 RepID=A0A3A8NT50_9BACT|nr:hypothetical protein [Corallococcus sicarius]RKH47576.1 hypothetical protein D7X12_02410 [Corallococcus sicarius]